MQLPLNQRMVDMRVSSLPTLHGEKIVLRILDQQSQKLGFAALGLPDTELAHVMQAIAKPNGMVLITGPTGSGKTVTLQTMAQSLSRIGVPVFMADVKGDLTGLSQAGKLSDKMASILKERGLNTPTFETPYLFRAGINALDK
jgi:ATP-dependent protease Clp ATPase subunit